MSGLWKPLVLAGSFLPAVAAIAGAADEIPEYEPAAVVGGWYLRGDIGLSAQQLHGGLDSTSLAALDNLDFPENGRFSTVPKMQFGIGHHYTDWLRFDLTGEYRAGSKFSARARYSDPFVDANPDSWDGTLEYDATMRGWLMLANAYVDLGTWMGITPYAGAGIGLARVTMSGMRVEDQPAAEISHGGEEGVLNFAWALHAGLGLEMTDRLTLDIGYRYTRLGDGRSGDLVASDGTNLQYDPVLFEDIVSHDLNFGLRYKFF